MIRIAALLTGLLTLATPVLAIEIQEVTSPGGIQAWLVEEHSLPFTALEIRFRGGTSLDAPGKRGATNLMMGLLEEGAGDLDARGFAEAEEELAAKFTFDSDADAASISARFLTENRDAALDLLRLAIQAPTFGESDIERVKGQVLSGIRSSEKDPNDIASHRFNHEIYGDHPYGTDDAGTIDGVNALTRDDMIEARARVFARDRLYVGAAGDITPDELGAALDRLFDGLADTGAAKPPRAEYLRSTGGVTVVDFDTPQSVAIFGHQGIRRDDPDFFAAYVMNYILGGSTFGSRLTEEVREKRGLTYGIGSYLVPLDLGERIVGSVASQNDKVAEAIGIVKQEWARMAEDGITEEELQQAKTYLTGEYPLRFDGNANIAGILVGMQTVDLTPDYILTRNDKVEAVTLEDVRRVAKRLLKPEDLYFVVVGRPEGLVSTN